MTVKINADTSDGLKFVSDTSGTVDIQSNGTTVQQVTSSSIVGKQDIILDAGKEFCIGADDDVHIGRATTDVLTFNTGGVEKGRITAQAHGELLMGTVDGSPWNNSSEAGCGLNTSYEGLIAASRANGDPFAANRTGSDGHLMAWYRDGSLVGQIEVSSGTVTYAAFTGTHPSRLSDNSKPDLLRGTVIETIDAMCDWYELEFTNAAGVSKVDEISLPEGKSVGDTYTMDYLGESVTGTIRGKQNHKHTMCKVSDTEDSARVYGIFSHWHTESPYNELMVNAVGTSIIRVANGVTVSAGDLLSSKGDGTAKLQGDDIIKTKTIGKVLSNVKQETYDDGSFTVPCALYCG
jgi:hypothetical protein